MPYSSSSQPEGAAPNRAEAELRSMESGELRLVLRGEWLLELGRPRPEEIASQLPRSPQPSQLIYDSRGITDWDTGLVTFLVELERQARELGITADPQGLPDGARRLVAMASAVPERAQGREARPREGFLERVGNASLGLARGTARSTRFLGELTLSFGRLLRGKAALDRKDFFVTVQEVSVEALGIVSLVGFLVGVILSFIGAVQFEQFGAGIYTANLLGLGIVRELGPIMAGVIMAGRTGASFAAYIGTMKVNEEIDALRTLGIDPIDYLVLPRALALMIMMPLVTLYADLMGLIGGTVVSLALLDVTPALFIDQLRSAIDAVDVLGGLFMASVFGVLIALAGCQRGIDCGNSAQAVGEATTSAVVTCIVAIVASCAVLNFAYTVLGI